MPRDADGASGDGSDGSLPPGEAAAAPPEVVTIVADTTLGPPISDQIDPGAERLSMTRSRRVIGAVKASYVYQALVLVAGLWLTPFLITHLGDRDYGLWIAGTQIVAWLSVMDLGVVSLVPREAAYAIGAASASGRPSTLPRLLDRTLMLLLWQLPFVAVVTTAVWLLLPAEYAPLTGPLLLVFGIFVVGFPFRILQAILTGVQDLVFVSVQTSIAWSLGFVLTIALVNAGFGLYALALSFFVVQLFQYVACGWRLWRRHRAVLPTRLTPLPWSEAKSLLMSGTWVSVAQIAQVLLVGTDLIIITQVLGAAAVVPYAITGKLISVLANQPATLIQAALPGISEIRGMADIARLQRVAAALGQAMLIASSLVFCVVLIVNESFVEWWGVPDNPYAGDLLTLLLLLAMVARHANFAIVLTLFSLGGERRISLTTLADGALTVIGTIVLVRAVGIIGAPIASLLGGVVVSLPANLLGLRARAGIPVLAWIRPLAGWAWRFGVLAAAAWAAARLDIPATFVGLAAVSVAIGAVVAVIMAPVALRPPLGAYVAPRLGRFRPGWPRDR